MSDAPFAENDAPDYQLLYEGTLRNIERMAREPARVRMPSEIRRLDAGRVIPPAEGRSPTTQEDDA